MNLPSTKPYMLRAIWEWCSDHGYTPYLAVIVDKRTAVPREFVRDGQIVLNISPEATNRLQIGNELVEFQARFGGVARDISVPVDQVAAIYAKENGAGMAFDVGDFSGADVDEEPTAALIFPEDSHDEPPPEDEPPPRPDGGRPKLQRIK